MKKNIVIIFLLASVLIFSACGNQSPAAPTAEPTVEPTATPEPTPSPIPEPVFHSPEEIITALKDAGLSVDIGTVYDEASDPNGQLGRPGCYTGKADFTANGTTENTVEVFDNAEDCADRYAYLQQFAGADLGAFGLNQYVYASDLAILRISFDVLPSDAEEYEAAFYDFVGQPIE